MTRLFVRPQRSVRALAAVAAALALGLAAGAQEGDDDEAAGADPSLCGASFATSGASSNVAYVGGQLAACDALVASADTAAALLAAEQMLIAAHQGALERWRTVNAELVAAAEAPPAPLVRAERAEGDDDAGADDAGARLVPNPNDPWAVKRDERHAVETGMDGLRILMRLSNQLAERYADPAALAAALEGPAAARVPEVLAGRQVCASKGLEEFTNRPGTPASWLAYAELDPVLDDNGDETAPLVDYEIEIVDGIAARAEAFVTEGLASAPSLGVSELTSFVAKDDCDRDEFPSERNES